MSFHAAQEGALLGEDQALLLREAEVFRALAIGLEARAIGLIRRHAVEGYQTKGDVVGALERQPIADHGAAAAGDDGEPAPRVSFESIALERIDLVADEHCDRHAGLHVINDATMTHSRRECFGGSRSITPPGSRHRLWKNRGRR